MSYWFHVRWLIGRWLTAVSVCVSAVSPGASQRRSDRVRKVPAGSGRRSESSGEKRRAVSGSTSLRTPLSRFHNGVSIFILTESVREDGEHLRENKEVSCSSCSLFHGQKNWLIVFVQIFNCVSLCCSLFMWVQPELTQKLYVGLLVAFISSCLLPYKLLGFIIGTSYIQYTYWIIIGIIMFSRDCTSHEWESLMCLPPPQVCTPV